MGFYIVNDDLVKMNVDCIVSNANVNLKMVEGVSRAIFHSAGDIDMMEACRKIGKCDVGNAVMTPSFNIKNTKAIIHAVGPNYINGKHDEEENLINAYKSVFNIMKENNFKSVAFPLLSLDFNYPFEECYSIAKKIILKNIKENPEFEVYLCFFKHKSDLLDSEEKDKINKFILSSKAPLNKFDIDSNNNVTSNSLGLSYISKVEVEKELNDIDVEFNGNLQSGYLNKLRLDSSIIPSKNALYGISVALKLKPKEFIELASKFGYIIQFNTTKLNIIKYFVLKGVENVFDINDCLFDLGLKGISSL